MTSASEEESTILITRDPENASIAIITLNRPDRLNALTPEMGPLYAATLQELDADPSVRAIVVTGAGRGFCSGADLSSLAGSTDDLLSYVRGQTVQTLPLVALTLATPVATAINGPCAGIGFVLAMSADARFVASDATLSTTFARLGLVAEYGIAWLLPRLVGLPVATDLLLTGRTVTGEEAARLGLATGSSDPVGSALTWAREVATNSSPRSTAMMKRQLLEADGLTLTDSVSKALDAMAEAFTWPDLAEALEARAHKRAPQFPDPPGRD
ncbi:MAG: enoyl-CoA hydratase-related protein [Actinomycetota bacterium]